MEFLSNTCGIPNWNRALDYHNCFWVVLDHQLDYGFNRTGIKEILLAVIVGRCSNYYKICIAISHFRVQRGSQIQFLLTQSSPLLRNTPWSLPISTDFCTSPSYFIPFIYNLSNSKSSQF